MAFPLSGGQVGVHVGNLHAIDRPQSRLDNDSVQHLQLFLRSFGRVHLSLGRDKDAIWRIGIHYE